MKTHIEAETLNFPDDSVWEIDIELSEKEKRVIRKSPGTTILVWRHAQDTEFPIDYRITPKIINWNEVCSFGDYYLHDLTRTKTAIV